MLCVRLVFCLYAEDSGIFGKRLMFHDYLSRFESRDLRRALIDLFRVLDTKVEDRDPYMEEELSQFPYVNGGLFANEDIEIPNLNENVKELLLSKASEDFDWSEISPTIFGAVFESTLNPETRRKGGMHYTSIENIHKVIDPLFLDDLKEELAVNIIEQEILKYRDLKSGIPKGDKGISWDGHITVFDGKGRTKNNFEYNINVQVKGRIVKKIKKGNTKFSIEKSDLVNYQKQKNGTLLLVVDIIDNLNYQIYYANLLPVDLKQLLENNNSKAKKPKTSILPKPIKESSVSSLQNICRNFALNSKRQMGIPIKDLSELKNIETIEFKVISEKGKLFDYILNNDVYTYAILKDQLKTMVALPKGDFMMVQEKIEKNVKVQDKLYYSSYTLTRQKEHETITMGKGIVFDLDIRKINFNFKGTLQDRITDMEFFVDLIKNRSVTINGATLDLPKYKNDENEEKRLIEEYNKKINDLKILRDKFLELNIDFKEDIDKLDKQSRNNLFLFKKIFCDNIVPTNLNIQQGRISFIKIGNCNIAILAQKNENEELKIYNYFSELKDIINIVIVKKGERPSRKNRTSPYFVMSSEDILKFSNFNAEIVFNSLNVIQNFESQSEHINAFMLELLKAYDKDNKRKDILDLAEKINTLLIQNKTSITNQLNKFQMIRRKRYLTQEEKNILIDLRANLEKDDNFNTNQCGIAILLENNNDYKFYYNAMDKDTQKEFDTYPIINLMNTKKEEL